MFLIISRTFKEATRSFRRNGWLTLAVISILTLSLYIISVSSVVTLTINDTLDNIQKKLNISVYFKPDVDEERIMEIQKSLGEFSEIRAVSYISKEDALEKFKKDNAHREIIIQSLEVIGDNPLPASLVIEANDPNQYQVIADYISKSEFSEDVSDVNYEKNKKDIDKLNGIIVAIRRVGISLGALLTLISLLMTFNTIRITIYSHKKEIAIMRLVGASNLFIRLPFIFEGMIYGIISSIFSMLILFTSIKLLAIYASSLNDSFYWAFSVDTVNNLMATYLNNFWMLFGGQLILGIALGVLGGFLAMRRYLKA